MSQAKRTPSKRQTNLERQRAESEEILKSMGGTELEGRRRTRSSVKGPPATPPPAAKKAKISTPSSNKRGAKRGKKNEEHSDDEKVCFCLIYYS